MQKVGVEVKCHEGVRQLSEPTFNQACDGVDNIVVQTRRLGSCAKRHFRSWCQIFHKFILHLFWLKHSFWQHYQFILFYFFTCLQNLVQLFCSTRWAWLPIETLSVEAIYFHVHQQHLNHFGHWVGFTGEHVHLNPEVKWAWSTFILLEMRQENERWGMCRNEHWKTCHRLWIYQATHWYL